MHIEMAIEIDSYILIRVPYVTINYLKSENHYI
jgi:hypothetical protein